MPETCDLPDRELDAFVAEHIMGQTVKPGWAMMVPEDGWLVCSAPRDSDDEGWIVKHPIRADGHRWDVVDFYSTDLNACAKAEAKIAEMGLCGDYTSPLWQMYWDQRALKDIDHASAYMATARQRCEAMYLIRDQIEAAKAEGRGKG